MAVSVQPSALRESVASSRLLVVGAGGIGCELIKNLVLTGFKNLVIVSIPECRSVYEVYLSAPSALGRLGYY